MTGERSAHRVPLVLGAAFATGPDFVARAEISKRAFRPFTVRASQGVRAAGRTGLTRCRGRSCQSGFEGLDPFLELPDPRRQGLESFPKGNLFKEFHYVAK